MTHLAQRCVLTIDGDLDLATVDDLRDEALVLLAGSEGCPHLTVDLGGMTFMDSTGLGFLMWLQNAANACGLDFQLRNIPDQALRILAVTRMLGVFTIEN